MRKQKFVMEIELGNDAMRTAPDVSKAIVEVAARLTRSAPLRGDVHDVNGNRVGSWRFTIVGKE